MISLSLISRFSYIFSRGLFIFLFWFFLCDYYMILEENLVFINTKK